MFPSASVITMLTSILIFGSVVLFVRYVPEYFGIWIMRRVNRDIEKYSIWTKELFIPWSPEQIKRAVYWANGLIIILGLGVWLLTRSIVFAVAIAFGVYWLPVIIYRVAKERRLQRFEEQLPDAVDVMVSSVRAGNSLPQAIEDVFHKEEGPVGQEFGVMAKEYAYGGMSVEGVLDRARARLNVESFTMISSALIINSARGGDVLHMLERMSKSLRELHRLKKKIASETSEVRAQEKVILFLTPVFGVLICFFDPAIPNILLHSALGNILLVFVFGCQLLSIWWIHRIIRATI